ncbi:helix-turn-helix transcriptional regulator [Zeimonas arvi]|uniref:AlpA family phage regulatory protein n=1 Tax=Zeimonas arvi TaxID=2498847 RepID=A0A5C8P293_9BURK|nr:AlpA family phage regulatory protein [Zeimonas arvi]
MEAMRILRKPEAAKILGLAVSSLDDLRRSSRTFPKAIQLSARSVGFLESELHEWIASRPRVTVASAGAAATDPKRAAEQHIEDTGGAEAAPVAARGRKRSNAAAAVSA